MSEQKLFPFQITHNAWDDEEWCLWVMAPSQVDLAARINDYLKGDVGLVFINPLPNTPDYREPCLGLDYVT